MNEHPKKPLEEDAGELDPEIAHLMGIEGSVPADAQPAFNDLFDEEAAAAKGDLEQIDLSRKGFSPLKRLQGPPHRHFADREYYQKVLSGEGEPAKKVHDLLSSYLKETNPKEKSLYRARLDTAYWELCGSIVRRLRAELPKPKLLMLRFGLLSPSLLSAEQLDLFSRVLLEDETGEPVYYQDEWLLKIAQGKVNPSSTDEVKKARQDAGQKLQEKAEKRRGQRQAEIALLQNKLHNLEAAEQELQRQVEQLVHRDPRPGFEDMLDGYTPPQRELLTRISGTLRTLGNMDREIRAGYTGLEAMNRELDELDEKSDGAEGTVTVGAKTVSAEFASLRQMAKMSVGRQGNHFPVLMKQYFRPSLRDIATRENVIQAMAQVEALDAGLFVRTFKNQTQRVVPYVLLLPNYGETGICWEPFERHNRAGSRGRLAIPIFPKDLFIAVICALADLRWQVAKEKAQHYWMEEGLTGRYYQWFAESKQKGDVKDAFIRDYILWITRESQGTQKLERDVRGLFWRMMPFPQSVKDNLRNRGFVYSELYKKDQNIARSDGY